MTGRLFSSFCALLLCCFFLSSSVYAFTIRCVADQTVCEISSNRLAIGDFIGVFSQDQMLVAVGRVESINGLKRSVSMIKRYAKIYKGYEAVLLEDRQAQDPAAFFQLPKQDVSQAITGKLGLLRMEAGDVFVGFLISGAYLHRWRNVHILARVGYLSASGKATAKETSVDEEARASAIMASGGLVYRFLPHNTLSFDMAAELGITTVTVNVADGGNAAEYLNRRIQPGIGLLANASIHAMYDLDSIRLGPGLNFTVIQKSQNLSLTVEAHYVIN